MIHTQVIRDYVITRDIVGKRESTLAIGIIAKPHVYIQQRESLFPSLFCFKNNRKIFPLCTE